MGYTWFNWGALHKYIDSVAVYGCIHWGQWWRRVVKSEWDFYMEGKTHPRLVQYLGPGGPPSATFGRLIQEGEYIQVPHANPGAW